MKKLFSLVAVLLLAIMVNSCSPTIYPLRGNYELISSITTSTPYDKVWNNVIDFFAENNIPIGTLSKDSGIITATNISLDEKVVSYENKDGVIVNSNAWFVVPYFSGVNVVGARATCSFNVRVRQLEDGNVRIQVNISNLTGYYTIEILDPLTLKKEIVRNNYPRECCSTGKFEAALLVLFNE